MRAVRRQARRATRVGKWPLHTKFAVGAWIPVLIVAIALYTGPNRRSAAAPAPTTTTTAAPVLVPPPAASNTGAQVETAADKAQQAAIQKWIANLPTKRTLLQGLAVAKLNAQRLKMMLAQEKAANSVMKSPQTAGG
jgi:hypothetical protein